MKTTAAEEAARWIGADAIRDILRDKLSLYETSLYPTSISSPEIDHLRPVALLSAVVQHHRIDIVAAIESQAAGSSREALKVTVLDELSRISGLARALSQQLQHNADQLDEMAGELVRT